MKALTVKQPWASLIVDGIKDIENRSWRTHFRGRICVHSSNATKFKVVMTDPQASAAIPVIKQAIDGSIPFGSIIGEVDIVDCVLNHQSIWAEQMEFDVCPETGIHILRKGQPYVWNWVLANPVKYDRPIMNVKGAQGFWKYQDAAPDILRMLETAQETISKLKLSMLVHPDCTEGSEFEDYAVLAQETEDEIGGIIAKAYGKEAGL